MKKHNLLVMNSGQYLELDHGRRRRGVVQRGLDDEGSGTGGRQSDASKEHHVMASLHRRGKLHRCGADRLVGRRLIALS